MVCGRSGRRSRWLVLGPGRRRRDALRRAVRATSLPMGSRRSWHQGRPCAASPRKLAPMVPCDWPPISRQRSVSQRLLRCMRSSTQPSSGPPREHWCRAWCWARRCSHPADAQLLRVRLSCHAGLAHDQHRSVVWSSCSLRGLRHPRDPSQARKSLRCEFGEYQLRYAPVVDRAGKILVRWRGSEWTRSLFSGHRTATRRPSRRWFSSTMLVC